MKLRMLMTRSALGGAYVLSILGTTLHMFTGISGDFAELSEHEVSSKTAQDTRDTRDSARALSSHKTYRKKLYVRQTVVTRLFAFT